MVKEAKGVKNYRRKHQASASVLRSEVRKFKIKDRKKEAKKHKQEVEQEQKELIKKAQQKQVDDFVSQAKTSKGPGYEKLNVDDFLSLGFDEVSDDEAAIDVKQPKSLKNKKQKTAATPAVRVPKGIQSLNVKKQQIEEEEEEEEDYVTFDDELEDEDDENTADDGFDVEDDDVAGLNGVDDQGEEDEQSLIDALLLAEEDDDDNEYGGAVDIADNDDDLDEAQALRDLQREDPKLYQQLLKDNPEMLGLATASSKNSDDDEESEEEQSKKTKLSTQKTATNIETLSPSAFEAIRKPFLTRQYNAKNLLSLIKLFKSAVLIRSKINNAERTSQNQKGHGLTAKKTTNLEAKLVRLIESPLYVHTLQFSLRIIPIAIIELLYLNNNIPLPFIQESDGKVPTSSPTTVNRKISWRDLHLILSDGQSPLSGRVSQLKGWHKIDRLVRSFFLSTFTLLKDSSDPEMIRLIMRSILPALPLLEAVKVPLPLLLKRVLHFWCYSADVSFSTSTKSTSKVGFVSDTASRLEAFLVLRRLTLCLDHTSHIKEAVMRGVYQHYVRVCKNVNAYNISTITFLSNCVTELYGIDGPLSYQLTFLYLRQLASQLRTYLLRPSSKGLRSIYNWQFINCVRLWGQVLSTYALESNSALRPLLYPFTQIATSILTLSSAPAYAPVKIVICECLTDVMFKCQVFIPIAPQLLDILRHPMFASTKHTATKKHMAYLHNELNHKLHISTGLLNSLEYKESLSQRTLDALVHHLSVLNDAVFFPEYAYPIRVSIKQILAKSKLPSLVRDLKQAQIALNDSLQTIVDRRNKFAFSPRDVVLKGVNGLSLLANTVAINALNQQNGVNGTTGHAKPTALQRLHKLREQKLDEIKQQRIQFAGYQNNEDDNELVSLDNEDEESEDDFDEDDEDDEFGSEIEEDITDLSDNENLLDEEEELQNKTKKGKKAAPPQKRPLPSEFSDDDDDEVYEDEVEDLF